MVSEGERRWMMLMGKSMAKYALALLPLQPRH